MSGPGRRALIAGAVGAAYVGASAASALTIGARTDLDVSFWPSAEVAAHGHPLLVYTANGQSDYPNANGPLSLVPLSLVAWIAVRLGFDGQTLPRTALALAVFSVFTLLTALEAARIVRQLRSERPHDWAPAAAAAAMLVSPPLWLAVTGFGHVEMPLQLWLVLLSVRLLLQRRAALAGVALGLALLSRSTTLLYLIPVGVFLATNGRWREAGKAATASLLTAALGIAPFLIADSHDVAHSLFTYRGALPINGGTLWFALRDSAVAGVVQHADALITGLAVLVACIALQRFAGSGGRSGNRLLAMLGIAALAFPMLAKTTLSYYMLEPFAITVTWWLSQRSTPRNVAVAVPLIVLLATVVADMGVDLPRFPSRAAQGLLISALLVVAVLLTVVSETGARGQGAVRAAPVVVAGQKTDA